MRKNLGAKGDVDKVWATREKILQENYFTESPFIRMLVPGKDKMGNYLVQIFRPKAIAKASNFFLDRYRREKKRARQ